MDKLIFAVRYRDALYSTRSKIKNVKLPTYVAVGDLVYFNDHLVISFTEVNNNPVRGLLIPKAAVIFQKSKSHNKVKIPRNKNNKEQSRVGIFWNDVVYFNNGNIPKQATKMYTEGQLFSQTSDAIVIKNPETIATREKKVNNHPEIKPTFLVIPKVLITGTEYYD